ncbi:4-oxalocrotonate tautomerase [Microbispora rosea subsp. aerata]|nr:4-oxalocrotonate tautomerase family protein [Microbispora rosea]GGO22500.1 4-oxalocrotonate tautomerase [Microbispora rosea subsp. aerata]GIH57430.1 4-oxalocrotonate tautomerase [Microbispora rosea subsp. aerata]GLJ86381.1 4-oxalocrotonate tautomerase [Microbispora rosea subsp. aerata]
MPIIDVSLLTGRTESELREMISAVHDAVVRSLGVPPESVRILVRELPPTHWAAGGETIAERRARS